MFLDEFHFASLLFRQLDMLIGHCLFNWLLLFLLIISIERCAYKLCVFSLRLFLCACYTSTVNILKHTFIRFEHLWLLIFLAGLLGLLLLSLLFWFKLRFRLARLCLLLNRSRDNCIVLCCGLLLSLLLVLLLLMLLLRLLLQLACAWLRTLLQLLRLLLLLILVQSLFLLIIIWLQFRFFVLLLRLRRGLVQLGNTG